MDKNAAIKRLDAIEAEAKELRKVIDGGLVFDRWRIYVAVIGDTPYLLVGDLSADPRYRFNSFNSTAAGWSCPVKGGQEAIDYVVNGQAFPGTVHEFTDTREALQFFLDNLKK